MSKAAVKEAKSTAPTTEEAPSPPATETEVPSVVSAVTVDEQAYEDLRTRAAKAEEHWERLVRTTADFDNFRKRAAREKQEAIRYANESLMTKLIPVLDSLDAALAATQAASDPAVEALGKGVTLVYQQLLAALKEAGLEEVDASGQAFDPNWHEAISQQECPDTPEGHVLQQVRKGYKLRDRLLRAASVIVARPPTPPA